MNTLDVKFFYIAFWLYFGGFIAYSLYVPFRKTTISKVALSLMIAGILPQTAAIIIRWATSEHVPLSNMYEYISLMCWMAVIFLFILIWKYKRPLIGSFISPLVFMLMVTASMLPKEVSQQLVPALQSYWLTIHVTLAALGSGAFVVACAVSFIYLIKVHEQPVSNNISTRALGLWFVSFMALPVVFHLFLRMIGVDIASTMTFFAASVPNHPSNYGNFFVSLGMFFPLAALLLLFLYKKFIGNKDETRFGSNFFALNIIALLLAALITGLANANGLLSLTARSPFRICEFFGVVMVVLIPVFLICFVLFYRIGRKLIDKIEFNLDLLDEINYKAIALGYPLYTVGALFAGAIWAEQAWGQFWSWDPKEVGSLVIWLFYSGFLHARYNRQWKGSKAAILSIFGFLMVLLSFFGNYFFGGQHGYT